MTYGWAILAAIIAIGVLAYFGAFSPGSVATGAAILNPPFYVNAWNVQADTGVVLEVRNNGGEDYTISSIDVDGCGAITPAVTIIPGDASTFTIACTPALTEGSTFKGALTITYNKLNSLVDLTSTGTIAEKVTA